MRTMTRVVALVPPVVAFLLLKPESFGDQTLLQLSTSQWVALLTALPAAVTYGVFFRAAETHPGGAMELHLDEFYALHPEYKPQVAPAVAPAVAAKDSTEDASIDGSISDLSDARS